MGQCLLADRNPIFISPKYLRLWYLWLPLIWQKVFILPICSLFLVRLSVVMGDLGQHLSNIYLLLGGHVSRVLVMPKEQIFSLSIRCIFHLEDAPMAVNFVVA